MDPKNLAPLSLLRYESRITKGIKQRIQKSTHQARCEKHTEHKYLTPIISTKQQNMYPPAVNNIL